MRRIHWPHAIHAHTTISSAKSAASSDATARRKLCEGRCEWLIISKHNNIQFNIIHLRVEPVVVGLVRNAPMLLSHIHRNGQPYTPWFHHHSSPIGLLITCGWVERVAIQSLAKRFAAGITYKHNNSLLLGTRIDRSSCEFVPISSGSACWLCSASAAACAAGSASVYDTWMLSVCKWVHE